MMMISSRANEKLHIVMGSLYRHGVSRIVDHAASIPSIISASSTAASYS